MIDKKELEERLVNEAIDKAKKDAEVQFEELSRKEEIRKKAVTFLNGYPLITSRKWFDGIDDGMHTYFYKTLGVDTDGVNIRIAFYLLFWASEKRLYIESDSYSKHANPSCGFIGQLLHYCGDLQEDYDDNENGTGEHKGTLRKYVRRTFPEMKALENECERMIKDIKDWPQADKEVLDDVLNEICQVKNYKEEQ